MASKLAQCLSLPPTSLRKFEMKNNSVLPFARMANWVRNWKDPSGALAGITGTRAFRLPELSPG